MKLNFCLFGPLIKKMSIFQRISGFVYTVSSLFTIFLTASLFTMPIVLVSGGTLVAYADYNQLRWLIRFCFFALFFNRVNEWVTYMPAGYRLGQRESGAMMWMAPCRYTTRMTNGSPNLTISSPRDCHRSLILLAQVAGWQGGRLCLIRQYFQRVE